MFRGWERAQAGWRVATGTCAAHSAKSSRPKTCATLPEPESDPDGAKICGFACHHGDETAAGRDLAAEPGLGRQSPDQAGENLPVALDHRSAQA